MGAILEAQDVAKAEIPKFKQNIENLEVIKDEIAALLEKCEKQCAPDQDKEAYMLNDSQAIVLPKEWTGPYTTSCPQKCQKITDHLNGYPERFYPLLAKKRILTEDIQGYEIARRATRNQLLSAHVKKHKDRVESIEAKIKELKSEVGKTQKEIDSLIYKLELDKKGLTDCEALPECKPKDKPKKTACSFPDSRPAIAIGPNNEVGTGKALTDKVTNQAKGMAMGALGGIMGGSGMSVGGGGGGDQPGSPMGGGSKEPPLDKDPTSGSFKNVSAGGTDISLRSGMNNEGFVVSVKLNDSPGDGTFHAMWLEDGEGNIILPRRFLLIDIYRNWKLSVWWDYKRWRDNELVEHRTGDSMTVGTDYLGTIALFEGAKGVARSIWNSLGFGTAVKGAKHIGAVFPASAVKGPCSPLKLVTHISLPKQDPVMTQVVVADIDTQSIGNAAPTSAKPAPKQKSGSNDGARDGESKGGKRVRERANSQNQ